MRIVINIPTWQELSQQNSFSKYDIKLDLRMRKS